MLAIKVDVTPGCSFGDPGQPESLEIADFRTRIESCGGQFSLSHRRDGIRIWSSWPIPSQTASPADAASPADPIEARK